MNHKKIKTQKKCILVNCFASSNEMRVEPIREVLEEIGYKTIYVSSDYHHALKRYVTLDSSITPIHVSPYKKNLSISRLLSHREFSKKVYDFLCKEQPDLIYIKFPPNTLVKVAYEYKKNHRNCKIILDLFDLWPEALPISRVLRFLATPLLKLWASYRNKYVSCADLVLTECDMYQEKLKGILPRNTHTLYLAKQDIPYYQFHPAKEGQIRLCYLGGINNLIDLDALAKIVDELMKYGTVSIDIIGDGVSRDKLIQLFEERNCEVKFHGIIFDEAKKYKIMSNCDFGINLVKESVQIALSIKSIEYFRAGLAVINNVGYDTWKIIEKMQCGVNYDSILSHFCDVNQLKNNSRNVYENLFSVVTIKGFIRDCFIAAEINF